MLVLKQHFNAAAAQALQASILQLHFASQGSSVPTGA
jgi:hypothetical protein